MARFWPVRKSQRSRSAPNPLFNGVRRLIVAGLDEPTTNDAAGTVTITAPHLDATLRGSLERADHRVVITLP